MDCPICYNECPVRELYTFLGCSHFYCFDCLRAYYQTALDEVRFTHSHSFTPCSNTLPSSLLPKGRVLLVRCPTPGCKTEVHPGDMEAVMDHEWVEKFEDFALLAMLRLDVNTRWCPKVNCGASITVDPDSKGAVECPKCHTQICSECGRLDHPGKTCEEEANLTKPEDVQQLEEWAKNRAKKCPGCSALTEKNHGCQSPLLSCSLGLTSFDFFWIQATI